MIEEEEKNLKALKEGDAKKQQTRPKCWMKARKVKKIVKTSMMTRSLSIGCPVIKIGLRPC